MARGRGCAGHKFDTIHPSWRRYLTVGKSVVMADCDDPLLVKRVVYIFALPKLLKKLVPAAAVVAVHLLSQDVWRRMTLIPENL